MAASLKDIDNMDRPRHYRSSVVEDMDCILVKVVHIAAGFVRNTGSWRRQHSGLNMGLCKTCLEKGLIQKPFKQ